MHAWREKTANRPLPADFRHATLGLSESLPVVWDCALPLVSSRRFEAYSRSFGKFKKKSGHVLLNVFVILLNFRGVLHKIIIFHKNDFFS